MAGLSSSTTRDPLLSLQLPQDGILESLNCGQLRPLQQQCTYTVRLASHALRHASHLLSLLSIPLVDYQLSSNDPQSYHESIPWLMDACLRMNVTQNRWQYLSHSCLPQLFRNTINILDTMKLMVITDLLVKEKVYTLLVYLCVDALTRRQAPSGLENVVGVDDRLLSVAVVKISEACLSFMTVSRLASLQIIPIVDKLIGYEKITPTGSDLWVSWTESSCTSSTAKLVYNRGA